MYGTQINKSKKSLNIKHNICRRDEYKVEIYLDI
jgi:hypothetical protein